MLKTFVKPQQVGILIVILFVSVAHIGTTDHICKLDADSWILPEEGIWPFSYYQGSEAGASIDINSPVWLDGEYVPGEGITAGQTASRGVVSYIYGIYENGLAVPNPDGGIKADGVERYDYRGGYKFRNVFHEWRYGDGAESLTPISNGVISITNQGFEDHDPPVNEDR